MVNVLQTSLAFWLVRVLPMPKILIIQSIVPVSLAIHNISRLWPSFTNANLIHHEIE